MWMGLGLRSERRSLSHGSVCGLSLVRLLHGLRRRGVQPKVLVLL